MAEWRARREQHTAFSRCDSFLEGALGMCVRGFDRGKIIGSLFHFAIFCRIGRLNAPRTPLSPIRMVGLT